MEQRHPDFSFQARDGSTQRRLGDADLLRRARDMLQAAEHAKVFQLKQFQPIASTLWNTTLSVIVPRSRRTYS
jgi:hypothetical protein